MQSKSKPLVILGIDPGTATTGFGVMEVINGRKIVKDYGVITTSSTQKMSERLEIIYNDLNTIISTHKPDHIAIEEVFYTNNAKTVISVSQARGVVLLAARLSKSEIAEYTPLQIKLAVTGYGRSNKAQVQQMVKRLTGMKDIISPDDAADAIGICITHSIALSNKSLVSTDTSYRKKEYD